MKQIHAPNRWIILLASCFIAFCAGLVYLWSVFVIPVCDARGWDTTTVANMGGLMVAMLCLGSTIGGNLLPRLGARITGILGGIMLGGGILITTLFNSVAAMYIFYGTIAALGAGVLYNTGIFTNAQWFPDRKGLVVGIFLGVFGLSTTILASPVSTMLVSLGVNATMRILGIAFAGISIGVSVFFMQLPPEGTVSSIQKAGSPTAAEVSVTLREAIKGRDFWQLLLTVSLAVWTYNFISSYTTVFVQQYMGFDAAVALACISICGIGQAAGRLGFGVLCDIITPNGSFYLSIVFTLAACFGMPYVSDPTLMIFLFFLLAAGYGGRGAIYPPMYMERFGPKYSSSIYSTATLGATIAPFVAPVVTGNIMTSQGTFTPSFFIAGGIAIISALMVVFLSPKTPLQKKIDAELTR